LETQKVNKKYNLSDANKFKEAFNAAKEFNIQVKAGKTKEELKFAPLWVDEPNEKKTEKKDEKTDEKTTESKPEEKK